MIQKNQTQIISLQIYTLNKNVRKIFSNLVDLNFCQTIVYNFNSINCWLSVTNNRHFFFKTASDKICRRICHLDKVSNLSTVGQRNLLRMEVKRIFFLLFLFSDKHWKIRLKETNVSMLLIPNNVFFQLGLNTSINNQ